MLKQAVFMSAFAVALVASPSEAQERRTCAWNDMECIRRGGEPQAREDERSCKWNDMECIRREQERARREDDADRRRSEADRDRDRGRYERDDDRYDRDGRWERDRRGRGGKGRDVYGRGSRMPNMASALAMRNGRGIPGDARPWVGRGPVRVELVNRDRDRVPERATIRILGTDETQVWVDRNNDGRADLMRFYRNGRLVRELK